MEITPDVVWNSGSKGFEALVQPDAERVFLDQDQRVLTTLLDILHEGVYFVDRDRRITYWNRGAERLTGYGRTEMLGRGCRDNLISHVDCTGSRMCGASCPLTECMTDGMTREVQAFVKHKNGVRVPVLLRAAPIRDSHGAIIGAIQSFEQHEFERPVLPAGDEIHDRAHRDSVTGVGNREFTETRLRDQLERSAAEQTALSVLLVEVDDLAEIKGYYGRDASDAALRVIAGTIASNLRSLDFLGRWDEASFLVALDCAGESEVGPVAKRLRLLAQGSSIRWWGSDVPLTVSIGASVLRPGDTAEQLLLRVSDHLHSQKGLNRVTADDK